jgi:glycosyltransferase involved in cell wall biosynthesis
MITALENELDGQAKVVLHLHGIYNANTYLISLFSRDRRPIVAQSHDPLEYAPRGLRQIQYALRKIALRNVGRFFVLSDAELKYFSAMFGVSRIRTHPLGIDLKLFKPASKRQARLKLGWRLNQAYLLYVGRIEGRKGLPYLMKAARLLISRFPDLHLVIVGSGAGGVSRMLDSMNLTGNVTFVEHVPHNELPTYYNAADLSVLPSLREAWPRVIMESLACQTPVVATWTGCVPTLIRQGMKGLYVVPMRDEVALANKISQVLPGVTKTREVISRKKLRRYDWNCTVRDLLIAYEELLDWHGQLQLRT